MSQKKKIIDQLKKDFKKAHGGLGGLDYSTAPMKYDKMFEKQANMILQSQQPKIQPNYLKTPGYGQKPKPVYPSYGTPTPSSTPSYRPPSTGFIPWEDWGSEAYHKKGQKLQEEGKYNEAIKEFQEALNIKPNYTLALFSIGLCFKELKVYNKAIEYFKKAIKLDSNHSKAWKCLGNVYEEMENYNKAIESYEKAVEFNSGYKEAWEDLGKLYQNLGGYQNAIYCYKKVKKLAPSDKDIRRILKKLKNLKKAQK